MRASRRILAVLFAVLSIVCLPRVAYAQASDQVAAERLLGPQWRQLSRRAGMIFAGTVLRVAVPSGFINRPSGGTLPAVQLQFRVDHPIAGVEPGQILTIHEWSGAQSLYRPMISGQHILIFLYAPSWLGLTSPVGGSLGLLALDSSGMYMATDEPRLRQVVSLKSDKKIGVQRISVEQLERAIRRAREE